MMSRTLNLATMVSAAALCAAAYAAPAAAADLGGNCCADLEERIAELEATTVRKGNRKVSLTLYGSVNQAILFWDDEQESNAYVVDNIALPSFFGLTGEAGIAPGWKAGYKMELWVDQVFSSNVTQNSDDAAAPIFIWLNHWYIQSEKYGKISLGIASRASDAAPEQDLSGTADATYSLVSDIGFGFGLRRRDGGISSVVWGQVAGYNFTGETANIIRYDSPTFAGFTAVASWGEDDMTDVGLYYAGDHAGFTINAGVAYSHVTDENGLFGFGPEYAGPSGTATLPGRLESDTVTGSISILHNPTGLNATIAAGQREYDGGVEDVPAQLGLTNALSTPEDISYVWAKLGWIAKLHSIGSTNFYGEYGWYENGMTAGADEIGINQVASLSLSGNPALVCAGAGNACRIVGSESEIWGFGVVQNIDAAAMTLYLGYRHWEADFDLVDINGNAVAGSPLEDHFHVISGARINF